MSICSSCTVAATEAPPSIKDVNFCPNKIEKSEKGGEEDVNRQPCSDPVGIVM